MILSIPRLKNYFLIERSEVKNVFFFLYCTINDIICVRPRKFIFCKFCFNFPIHYHFRNIIPFGRFLSIEIGHWKYRPLHTKVGPDEKLILWADFSVGKLVFLFFLMFLATNVVLFTSSAWNSLFEEMKFIARAEDEQRLILFHQGSFLALDPNHIFCVGEPGKSRFKVALQCQKLYN